MNLQNKTRKIFPVIIFLATAFLTLPLMATAREKIAFTSTRDGNEEIYIMNADGSHQTRLTNNPAVDSYPSFSHDGNKIVFVSARDIGQYVGISVMNSDGSNQIQLTNNGDLEPEFSPDDSKIVFWSYRDDPSHPEIYVMNSDGSNLTRLTNNIWTDWTPSFSADGQRIAFTSDRDGDGQWEIYVMNSDGSNQTRLTNNPAYDAYPSFSPDGSKIAFTSLRDGQYEIYVMNSDGSNQTRLSNNPAYDAEPSWGNVPTAPPVLSNVSVSSPVNENSVATLSGAIADPDAGDSFTLTVNWGDGSPLQVFNYPAGTTSFMETHQYADDDPTATASDSYAISLTLEDNGGDSDSASTSVAVNNVAPTLNNIAFSPSPINVGNPTTLSGTVNDVGALDSHAVVINWGDGSPTTTLNLAAGVSNFSATHQYNNTGNYTALITATDDDTGAVSTSVNVTINTTVAPDAPTGLTATAVSASQINLAWTDNSNNENGFVVERCKNRSCTSFSQIAQTGANVTSFSDTGLSSNMFYYYRVRAVNNGTSAYSNTASAKTPK